MLGSFFQSNCFSYQTLTLTLTFTRVFMYKKTRIHQNTFAFLIKCASFRGDTSTFPAFPLIFPGNSQNFLWILLTPLALMCPGLFILFLNLPLRLQLHNTIPISNNRSFIDPMIFYIDQHLYKNDAKHKAGIHEVLSISSKRRR